MARHRRIATGWDPRPRVPRSRGRGAGRQRIHRRRPGGRRGAAPRPEPCGACAHGEFDMCRNGRYRERGIKELDGYGAELWCLETDYAVRVDAEPGPRGRADGAGQCRRQGLGTDRAGGRQGLVRAPQRTGDRRRPHPTPRRAPRSAARPRRTRPGPGHGRAQARPRTRPRRHVPQRCGR
ncbi:hypothetical protein LV779_07210 [Streptomyces thinghirensis]|nr:hypothetical protein [Streptomyces thinghirensis]